jgi:hypothetical protein
MRPLPSEETTPPVMKIYRAMGGGPYQKVRRGRSGGTGSIAVKRARHPADAAFTHSERGQNDRKRHKGDRQPLGRSGQEIRRTARAKCPARAGADAEPAAFGPLHQHDGDQRGGHQGLDHGEEDEQGHERFSWPRAMDRPIALLARHVGAQGLRGKPAPPCRPSQHGCAQFSNGSLAARAMPMKLSAVRLAPPTNAPPTSGTAKIAAAFSGLTEPP